MAENNKNVELALLGIIAVLAIIGLVMMFTGREKTVTGNYVGNFGAYVSQPTYCTDSDYLRGRCVPGSGSTTGQGPRYQIQAGGAPIGDYGQGRYGIVP